MRQSHLIIGALATVAAISQSGCQMLPHSLQPNQLWKWNRQPARDVSYSSHDQPEFALAANTEPPGIEFADD